MLNHTENPIILIEKQAAEAGIKIDQLCEVAGIARSTLTRAKNNTSDTKFSTIRKLDKALNKLKTSNINKS